MQIAKPINEFKFLKRQFVFYFCLMVTVTPLYFCILVACVLRLFMDLIPSAIEGGSFLIICDIIVNIIACILVLLVATIMAIIPTKIFFTMAWLFPGKLVLFKDAIEIHGKSRKVFIPMKSILYLLKTKGNTIIFIWKTIKGNNRFFVREDVVGKYNFSEINRILKNNERYIDDPQEISKIWNQLKMSNIKISDILKSRYDLTNGLTD